MCQIELSQTFCPVIQASWLPCEIEVALVIRKHWSDINQNGCGEVTSFPWLKRKQNHLQRPSVADRNWGEKEWWGSADDGNQRQLSIPLCNDYRCSYCSAMINPEHSGGRHRDPLSDGRERLSPLAESARLLSARLDNTQGCTVLTKPSDRSNTQCTKKILTRRAAACAIGSSNQSRHSGLLALGHPIIDSRII